MTRRLALHGRCSFQSGDEPNARRFARSSGPERQDFSATAPAFERFSGEILRAGSVLVDDYTWDVV